MRTQIEKWDGLVSTRCRWHFPIRFALILAFGVIAVLRAAAQIGGNIPPGEDPNDPTASREERLRRMRVLIEKRLDNRVGNYDPLPTPTPQIGAPANVGATNPPTSGQVGAVPPQLPGNAVPLPANTGRPMFPTAPGATTAPGGRGPSTTDKTAASGLLISAQARVPHATFFLSPGSFNVKVGDTFITRCRLMNPDGLEMNEIAVRLAYPAEALRPIKVHQDTMQPLLSDPADFNVDDARGLMHWVGQLSKPLSTHEVAALTIEWKAIAPTGDAWISTAIGTAASGAALDGESIMHGNSGVSEGGTGAHIRVLRAGDWMPEGFNFVSDTHATRQVRLAGFPDQRGLRPPSLWIAQPDTRILATDTWLKIDLGIDNPDRMVFDEIRLAGSFNPEAIEIVDTDRDNWVATGTNILDGPFRSLWPWDLHYANRVDNGRGLFYYRMAMTDPRQQPGGALARIFVHVKQATLAPAIHWSWAPDANPEVPTTGAYLYGENIYTRGTAIARADRSIIVGGGEVHLPGAHTEEKADPSIYHQAQ